jgi:hypothetical protein
MGIPYNPPSRFPLPTQNAARAYYWLHGQDCALARQFAHAVYRGFFVDDLDISSPETILQIAAKIGVSKDTLYEWMKVHPNFSDAMAVSATLSQAWWEEKGRLHIVESPGGDKLNASLYSRSMAARVPEDWREKSATELTGPNGGPLQIASIALCPMKPRADMGADGESEGEGDGA